jgi:hypothetical protein
VSDDDSAAGAKAKAKDTPVDVGPDPVWAVGVFVVGLVVMGVGGAATWHWVFNIGTAVLLLGVLWFLYATIRTSLLQEPVDWRSKVPRWLGGTADEAEAEAEAPPPKRKPRSKLARARRSAGA